ncbi:MAG: hypothetical protein R3E12_12170 [Candidatus Eisenbacteria bacterium]
MARHIPGALADQRRAGNKPKRIEEFGLPREQRHRRRQHRADGASPGWEEPAQTPEFDEYTIVLEGCVVADDGGSFEVKAGRR